MDIFIMRDSPKSVPEVGKVSVDEARLSGGVDANGRFGDLSSKVVLEVLLELLLIPQKSRDISHHDSSIADPLMLIVYPYHRINGRLEEVQWMRMPIPSLGPIGMILGRSKEVNSSHPHETDGYPPERQHPSDRDPEDDDEVNPKERPALRSIR